MTGADLFNLPRGALGTSARKDKAGIKKRYDRIIDFIHSSSNGSTWMHDARLRAVHARLSTAFNEMMAASDKLPASATRSGGAKRKDPDSTPDARKAACAASQDATPEKQAGPLGMHSRSPPP